MREILFIAVAGTLGTLSRYGLSSLTQRLTGAGFPYGTLLVNVLGSLIIGLVMQIGLSTDIIPRTWRLAITIGFLGAFTTFSTFSYETATLLQDGAWLRATINIISNLVLCIGSTLAGMTIGRILTGGA